MGSKSGEINSKDWLNALKHTLFVSLATFLVPLTQSGAFDLDQLKQSGITVGATALLTLASRFLQDNS